MNYRQLHAAGREAPDTEGASGRLEAGHPDAGSGDAAHREFLISKTGTYRSIVGSQVKHRREGSLPRDMGVRDDRSLSSVYSAVESAVDSGHTGLVPLPSPGNRERNVVQVRPAREAGWAVVSVKPLDERPAVPSPQVLMQLFELTATEAATAVDLMLCEDVNDLARKRGVSTETVRMHVKNVLRKTGMPNQKKLTGLLTRLATLSGLNPSKLDSAPR